MTNSIAISTPEHNRPSLPLSQNNNCDQITITPQQYNSPLQNPEESNIGKKHIDNSNKKRKKVKTI